MAYKIPSDKELEAIKKCFWYNPETGLIYWIDVLGSLRVKIGDIAGSETQRGYYSIQVKNKKYYNHRIAWFLFYGKWPEKSIDHIDGDGTNNRIKNLREVEHKINASNRSKFSNISETGHTCIRKTPYGKFRVQIMKNGKYHRAKTFDDINNAIAWRDKAREQVIGENWKR